MVAIFWEIRKMEASGIWEPYFKPTARVHSSGFRCFECGYLQIGDKNKAVKKVIIATRVDHIMNFEWLTTEHAPQEIHLDLLKSGEIRIFNNVKRPYWSILGFSDAHITAIEENAWPRYENLDEIWEKQEEKKR